MFFSPVTPPRVIAAMAFRGASVQAPEHTAAAIEHAIEDTVEWICIDVRRTQDWHHVLLSDESLGNITGTAGSVQTPGLEQIRALDAGKWFSPRFAGERVLTLSDALARAKNRANLRIRCHDVDPRMLIREIREHQMENQVVLSASASTLEALHEAEVANSGNENLTGHPIRYLTPWPGAPAENSDRQKSEKDIASWCHHQRLQQANSDKGGLSLAMVELTPEQATIENVTAFHREGLLVVVSLISSDQYPTVNGAAPQHLPAIANAIAAGVDIVETRFPEDVVAASIRHRLESSGKPVVRIAYHRGAGRYAPENTFPALWSAERMKADFVEIDVRTTADQQLVLLHDGSLDRTTTGTGPVREQTSERLQMLDAGDWFGLPFQGTKIPMLDDFLHAMNSSTSLYFDAKDISPEELAASLNRHGMTDRACVYQSPEYLERLMKIAPEIRRMPALRNADDIDRLAEQLKPWSFDVRWSILSRELIQRCHEKKIYVYSDALGPNETIEKYQQAIRDGIDVIQTDYPLRVLRAV
ncbi:MAG: glycerophosphodiester phosphodiesterase family protein, partial [Planctomyces sp.]